MTLCNRGQPLYTLAAGTSQGADGVGLYKFHLQLESAWFQPLHLKCAILKCDILVSQSLLFQF
jgi:hypothetical protein